MARYLEHCCKQEASCHLLSCWHIIPVWCDMSFWAFLLPKLILLFFWLSWGSDKPEILGFNFSRPSTSFYVTVFKMAASKSNMPYNDPSKLQTITSFVSKTISMIRRNVLVYVEVIMEWQLSLKSNMAAKIYEILHSFSYKSAWIVHICIDTFGDWSQ